MKRIDLELTDSTNTYAKKLCLADTQGKETYLVTALEQTAGRGRIGRSFSSLRNNGLYMTVAFPVGKKPEDSLIITIAAAVAAAELLQEAGCPEIRIKWVNDLYLQDRKVCGILTEAVTDPDTGLMRYAVVGLGVNVDTDIDRLPPEIRDKAGSIRGLKLTVSALAEKLAERVRALAQECLQNPAKREACLQKYRELSMILGKTVCWEENGMERSGIARAIDDEGHLIVETPLGMQQLDSGYVSVRL